MNNMPSYKQQISKLLTFKQAQDYQWKKNLKRPHLDEVDTPYSGSHSTNTYLFPTDGREKVFKKISKKPYAPQG